MKLAVLFMTAVVSCIFIGCGSNANPDPSAESSEPALKDGPQPKESEDQDAIKANSLLKASLDSWVFGDSKETWKQTHPDVAVFDERGSIRPFGLDHDHLRPVGSFPRVKLLKYEIGMSRGGEKKPGVDYVSYEFVVTLHAQDSQGNDIKRNQNYSVSRLKKRWTIMRLVAKD